MPFTIDENGIQTQTTADVVAEFNTKLLDPDEGFGPDFVTDDDEAIPRLMKPVAEVASLVQGRVRSAIAALTAGAAPGIFADNLARLTGVERRGDTYSTVLLELTGNAGATIPGGRVVRHNPTGTLWDLPVDVTLGGTGIALALARAQTPGPISIVASTDWSIVVGHGSLSSVVSTAASSPGRLRETDEALEARRTSELSTSFGATAPGIKAGVQKYFDDAGYGGVVDAMTGYVNPRSVPDAAGRPPGSVELLLDDNGQIPDQVIAAALWNAIAGGAEPWGTTTVDYVDESGTVQAVGFSRPSVVNIHIAVEITTTGAEVPTASQAALAEAIKAAVVAYAEANHPAGRNIVPAAFFPTVIGQLVPGSFAKIVVEASGDGEVWTDTQLPISPRNEAQFDVARVTVTFV